MARILIVDDEVGIRELLREILEDGGYQVSVAATATEAGRRLLADRPDLVLLDLSLPDRDGIALLGEWSASGGLPARVVMLSGHGSIGRAVEATQLGADDFLEKPISLPRLLSSVRRAIACGNAPPRRLPAMSTSEDVRGASMAPAVAWPSDVLCLPYREACVEFERAYFLNVLAAEGGIMSRVANRTGIERTHLYRKFRSLAIPNGGRKQERAEQEEAPVLP